jgi:hypothetical protein
LKHATTLGDTVNQLVEKHHNETIGHLSGFDRLVFKGTLRQLAVKNMFARFLSTAGVLLKDFGGYVEGKSKQLKEASVTEARKSGRPVVYLASAKTSKEDAARQIAKRDGIKMGLICILSTVEPCITYEIRRDRKARKLVLEPARRKCLHLYHYWIDPTFGFMSGRIQTWFPFSIQVCLNGREWLACELARHDLDFKRRDNCFTWLQNPAATQCLMDQQLSTNWNEALDAAAARLNPAHDDMLRPYPPRYYWSAHQTEWATDIMFRSSADLAAIYPSLTSAAISCFSAKDVMRFFGQAPHWNFQGEVVSSFKSRCEGVRVKHFVKANSVKAYDKHGTVLRLETTINDPYAFRVLRPKDGHSDGPESWRQMRRGVADLYRRAQVSQTINNRYADALASVEADDRLGEILKPISRSTRYKKRSVRGLRPFSPDDIALLQVVSDGRFTLNGFRNRDIRRILYSGPTTLEDQRRLSGRVSRLLRLLRAHRLIRRLPRSHCYVLTRKGRLAASAILAMQSSQVKQLVQNAA